MTKPLHNLFLLTFLSIFTFGKAQVMTMNLHHVDHDHTIESTIESLGFEKSHTIENKNEFSHILIVEKSNYAHLHVNVDHDHNNDVVLLDIISSDEGADFNCHGGFCMNELHFHKRGLSVKKQLFGYFMSISC